MSLCAVCGFEISVSDALCAHHTTGGRDDWAENNRLMCDLLHRGRLPPQLPLPAREDEFWTHAEAA